MKLKKEKEERREIKRVCVFRERINENFVKNLCEKLFPSGWVGQWLSSQLLFTSRNDCIYKQVQRQQTFSPS